MADTLVATPQQALSPLPSVDLIEELNLELPVPPFDPAIHLNYNPPSARHSFTELGLPVPKGCPDVSFTEPFQLFSEEGVRMIRREIFQHKFLDKFLRSWDRAPAYISGHPHDKEAAPFLKQAWSHPVTQAAINYAFGCQLQLQGGENDMGFVNIQVGAGGAAGVYNMGEVPAHPLPAIEGQTTCQEERDGGLIDKWHKDMTPLVLVLMLSDTSTMAGGETAIKTGDGRVVKTRGASMGGAVMMAGGFLEHAALRASNCSERLSLVNSYTFASPDADDTATTLKSVNVKFDNIPNAVNTIMAQKLQRLRDRCDLALQRTQARRYSGEAPNREEVETWVKEQMFMLKHTAWEMFERLPDYVGKDIPDGALENYLTDIY